MITFKIEQNGEEQTKEIPTSWNDLILGLYLLFFDLTGDVFDYLSLFTDVPRETLIKAKINGLEDLLVQLEWLHTVPEWKERPKVFMGELMPEDITFESIAPYQDARSLIQEIKTDSLKEVVEIYAKICAIYVHAVKNKWEGYDYDKAMLLLPEIYNQPAWEVVGLGSFFMVKFSPLRTSTKENSQAEATPRKKSKRVSKS